MSAAGALLLRELGHVPTVAEYSVRGHVFSITILKLVIAGLMAFFALLELHPRFEKMEFDPRYVPLGGAISGFFGGISGHQGAFRAPFLIRLGLSKEGFLATSIICAVIVDVTRLF